MTAQPVCGLDDQSLHRLTSWKMLLRGGCARGAVGGIDGLLYRVVYLGGGAMVGIPLVDKIIICMIISEHTSLMMWLEQRQRRPGSSSKEGIVAGTLEGLA
jgi:hypothetical protein